MIFVIICIVSVKILLIFFLLICFTVYQFLVDYLVLKYDYFVNA